MYKYMYLVHLYKSVFVLFLTDVKLLKAKDRWKDQSYFLSQISQKALRRALFPLGDLRKSEVKKIASKIGLTRIASKKEVNTELQSYYR